MPKAPSKPRPKKVRSKAKAVPETNVPLQHLPPATSAVAASRLPGAPRLFWEALKTLINNWKIFLGIIAIYGLLTVLLTQALQHGTSITDVKAALEETGNAGQLLTGTALFVYLLGSAGNAHSDAAGIYQFVIGLVTSLAVIWTLRQVYAQKTVRIRDGFYSGMFPLVPFVLVLCVIALQLLPFMAGAFLFGTVQANAASVTSLEVLLWGLLFFGLALASFYMLASSLFALYIVCLPAMQPMAALRSARQLVRRRRWTVLRKIAFLPLALMLLTACITIPLLLVATPVAEWIFFGVGLLVLPIAHSYMYRLYRELL